MKTIKDKQILVGADFAGYPLKEAVVAHLKEYGWTVTDVGVRSPEDTDTDLMFHRIGLRVGSMISEGEFERALIFCGTGMGIHIAASKCPGVLQRCRKRAGCSSCNYRKWRQRLAMGAFYVAPKMGCDIADAYLSHNLGDGYEYWPNFMNSINLPVMN